MAIVRAVKSGNWSDPTVWSTGALPTNADDVYSNTFTVSINTNPTVLSIRNSAATGVTAGGSFQAVNGFSITVIGLGVYTPGGSVTLLSCALASGESFTVNGPVVGATLSSTTAVTNTANGTLYINGNITGGSGTNISNAVAVSNSASSVLIVTGNITGGTGTSGSNHGVVNYGNTQATGAITGGSSYNSHGIYNYGTLSLVSGSVTGGSGTNISGACGIFTGPDSTTNITGNVTGGSGTSSNCHGINNNKTLTIQGNVLGGTVYSTFGVLNATDATLTVNGTVTARGGSGVSSAHGVNNLGTATIYGDVTGGSGTSGNCHGVSNSGTLSIPESSPKAKVTGGSNATGYGVYNNSSGYVDLKCDCYGSPSSAAAGFFSISQLSDAGAIYGNSYGGTSLAYGINCQMPAGTSINISGDAFGQSAANSIAVYNNGAGSIVITGNVTGGSGSGSHGAYNATNGTILITGNVTGGGNVAAYGAVNNSSGLLVVISGITSGATGYGVINNSVGTMYLWIGTAISSSSAAAIGPGSLQQNTIIGVVLSSGSTGVNPCIALSYYLDENNPNLLGYKLQSKIDLSSVTTYTRYLYSSATYDAGIPAASDVRLGTAYGANNSLIGTCAVPPPGSVAFGVPVDNTTGTAAITQSAIRSALGMSSANLDSQLSTINTNTLTRLAASSYSTPPSAASNAAAVRTELGTELSRIDAAISTRLAASSYTAPPTAAAITASVWAAADKTGYSLTEAERSAISTAVQAGILNENDGQQILNAIVGAIGNQNIDQVALVAAIRADLERTGGTLATRSTLTAAQVRTELSPELGNMDTTISSRLAGSAYTEPPSAVSIATAVWSASSRTLTQLIASAGDVASAVWSALSRTLTSNPAPSAADNAAAVRSELSTELERIDAAVSSRLAPGGTLARVTLTDTVTTLTNAPDVPSPEQIATEVWSTTARTVTGGTVDNVANSAPIDAAEIASSVRSELEPELQRLANTATTQEVAEIVEGAMMMPEE